MRPMVDLRPKSVAPTRWIVTPLRISWDFKAVVAPPLPHKTWTSNPRSASDSARSVRCWGVARWTGQ